MSFSIELMHILIENEGLLRMKNGQPLFMNDFQFQQLFSSGSEMRPPNRAFYGPKK